MIQAIQNRLRKDEGFTLIELMVVVLIIAILIAIAIPTFLGARERAQDRAAQSDLRNALLAAEVFYVDNESYDVAAATDLSDIEPELSFDLTVGNASTSTIGVLDAATEILFVRESESGTFFCIAKNESTGTTYGSGADVLSVDTVLECADASW